MAYTKSTRDIIIFEGFLEINNKYYSRCKKVFIKMIVYYSMSR